MEIPTSIQVVIGPVLHTKIIVGYPAIGNAAVMVKDGYRAAGTREEGIDQAYRIYNLKKFYLAQGFR